MANDETWSDLISFEKMIDFKNFKPGLANPNEKVRYLLKILLLESG